MPLDGATLSRLGVQRAEALQRGLLTDAPFGRLDELEHPDAEPLVPAAQRQTEGGGRLSLAVTGVHDQQGSVAALARREPVVGHDENPTLWHQAAPGVAPRTMSASAWAFT